MAARRPAASAHPPNASSCKNSRSSERCGTPSFMPPFSLRSGGWIRARAVSMRITLSGATISGVMSTEDRQAAQRRLNDLLTIVRGMPAQKDQLARLLEEAEALERAISAFHLEGIRFRIYNVDRIVQHPPVPLPAEAPAIVADVRKHLEAAGFHTRSHQSPV